jgi:hypothetical protein
MEKNRPCYEKRVGNIRVAAWENTSDSNGTPRRWHNISLVRRYNLLSARLDMNFLELVSIEPSGAVGGRSLVSGAWA